MSVSIRLAKFGKRHAPSYRVVVVNTRSKRSGAFIDIIGHYNPIDPTKEFTIDKKLYEEWASKGAIVSDAVKKLIDGTYEYKKYVPKKLGAKDEQSPEESAKPETGKPEEKETSPEVEETPETAQE